MTAKFEFVFVAMGQGDCCMVRCPNGKVIVVDCGSTGNPYANPNWIVEAEILLRDQHWAGGNGNRIHALVLTHPDQDHNNKVVQFFDHTTYKGRITLPTTEEVLEDWVHPRINIDYIYISAAWKDHGPLGNYTSGDLNQYIYKNSFDTMKVCEVTINSENDNWAKFWDQSSKFSTVEMNFPIDDQRFLILAGTTEETDWSVSIIAGNVPLKYGGVLDKCTKTNAGSLITLFEIGDKRALLCGDATFSTEKFLEKNHADLLEEIELVQIPHHGSKNASGQSFVEYLNPRAAVGSVGFFEHNHKLPRYEMALERWQQATENRGDNVGLHHIDYWLTQYKKQTIDFEMCEQKLKEWEGDERIVGTNYDPPTHTEKTFFYLTEPQGTDDIIAFSISKGYHFLKRKAVDTNLSLTSQRNQTYTLDAEEGVTYTVMADMMDEEI